MHSFLLLTQINFKRLILRNLRFFAFDIITPALFYLLFTKLMPKPTLNNFQQIYLIGMVIFATLLSSIITVANNILEDKKYHFWRLTAVTPLKRSTYYTSFFLVILFLTIIEIIAIEVVASIFVKIQLSIFDFGVITTLTTLGSICLMMFGALTAFVNDSGLVNSIASILVFPVAMLSGLWWPLSSFPNWLQKIGELLPTYQTFDLISQLIFNKTWALSSLLGEVIWLIIGIILMFSLQKINNS